MSGTSAQAEPPLAPARSIRARKRPGLVAIVYVHRTLLAFFVAAPLSAAVGSLLARQPRGDALLWEPGGVWLVEAARLLRASASALAAFGGLAAIAAAASGLVPLALLLAGLGRSGPLGAEWLVGRVGKSLGSLATLFALALGGQVLAVAIVVLGAEGIAMGMQVRPQADAVRACGAALALLAVLSLGVIHDLARAAAVCADRDVYGAVSRALDVARAAPLRLAWAYAWRGSVALSALVLSAWLAGQRGVGGSALAVAALHQAGIVAAVCMRASWLAVAVRAVVAQLEPVGVVASDEATALVPHEPPSPVALVGEGAAVGEGTPSDAT